VGVLVVLDGSEGTFPHEILAHLSGVESGEPRLHTDIFD
jgi:hypothetical protein